MNGIYIKDKATSKIIPTPVPAESSTLGSPTCCRTWGTGSRKNLMKVCLVCWSARSMPWAVTKVSSQAKVRCNGYRAITVTSKSSFLPEDLERRISRGYCKGIGPRSLLSMCMLGLRPKSRTRGRLRRSKHYQESLC